MNWIGGPRQQGFNIVELMVAIAIGLLITLAATSAYVSGLKTQYTQNDMTRLQESGRFALMLLSGELRKAGFHNDNAVMFPGRRFGKTSPLGISVVGGLEGTDSSNNKSDTLSVAFYGEDDFSQPTVNVADGRILDCLGNAINRDMRVAESFYIAADPNNNNEPTLYCKVEYTAGTTAAPSCTSSSATCPNPAPLIPGVESMQFLYGEDTDNDGVVNRYVTINDIANTDNVLSVMVSLVIRTPSPNAKISLDTTQKVFNHFGSAYAPGNAAPTGDGGSVFTAPVDGRMRVHFTSVIALRNVSS